MRVAWLVDGRLDQVSGGYLYDRLIVEHLLRSGVEVRVVSLPPGRYAARLARGVSPERVEQVAAFAPDIVVEDELSHPALLRADRPLRRRCPGLRRIGLVHHLRSSERGSFLAKILYRWIERRYLATLDAFIFNSRTTRASVQRLGLSASPSVIALPGADRLPVDLDADVIRSRAEASGPLRILFLGNVIPRKGLLHLVEAAALLPPHTVSVTVVGSTAVDPGYSQRVRRRAARLGLGEVVRFVGPLDGEALSQLMLNHQVLAVPSTYEGYGMALLEGMGHGLPVIAGNAGGPSEFVEEGNNGFLVEPGNPAGLAIHLAELHRDRRRLVLTSLSARRTYLAHPTWQAAGAVILGFLESLLRAAPSQSVVGPAPSVQSGADRSVLS